MNCCLQKIIMCNSYKRFIYQLVSLRYDTMLRAATTHNSSEISNFAQSLHMYSVPNFLLQSVYNSLYSTRISEQAYSEKNINAL